MLQVTEGMWVMVSVVGVLWLVSVSPAAAVLLCVCAAVLPFLGVWR